MAKLVIVIEAENDRKCLAALSSLHNSDDLLLNDIIRRIKSKEIGSGIGKILTDHTYESFQKPAKYTVEFSG